MSSLLVKERPELTMISSSRTASESMRRSASLISLRLLASRNRQIFILLLMKVTLTTLQDSKL
jgi:hypothetical protein